MLQINGLDDNKSEWNLNETHILIPMIDGDVNHKNTDKTLSNTLTLNSLEAGDPTVLTNSLEHNLIIGIDKNIFESSNFKNDLVIIHNSDFKSSVGYTICLDQEKNEIFWQSPSAKDKIYSSDKGIFEAKDILNFNSSGQESDKIDQQISLSSLESNTKADVEIFTEDIESENKCEEKSLLVNYVSNLDNYQSIHNTDSSKLHENTQDFRLKSVNPTKASAKYKDECESEKIKYKKFKKYNNCDDLHNIITQMKTKDEFKEDLNSLPEKSLPLKKKAKMKRTLICSENQRSVIKNLASYSKDLNMTTLPKAKEIINLPKEMKCDDVNKTLINMSSNINTQRILRTSLKKPKQAVADNSENKQTKNITEHRNIRPKNLSGGLAKELSTNSNLSKIDNTEFNDIFDLVESLRKSQMINSAVWQILHSGLKEIKVDILQEMNRNLNEKSAQKSFNYSPQLKAFALVLYFKQPAAFNYLAQIFKSGWPSLNVIKEWKKQMNSHLRSSVETERY